MYYLKCSQCGKLNQVKSEYLTFCSGCSKKLNNSFAEWKKVNQDKSFDDYKNELCILDPEIDNSLIQKQPKSKNAKYIIVSIIAFAIFYLIGHFGSEAIIKIIKSEKTSEEVLMNSWIKETYGSFGLAVETPVKLKKDDIPLPDNIKQMIEVIDVYSNMSDKGL